MKRGGIRSGFLSHESAVIAGSAPPHESLRERGETKPSEQRDQSCNDEREFDHQPDHLQHQKRHGARDQGGDESKSAGGLHGQIATPWGAVKIASATSPVLRTS